MVIPALREARPLVERQALHEMRVEQPRGTKEELRGIFSERVQKVVRCAYDPIVPQSHHIILILSTGEKMIARRNELFALHRCRPWLTMLIPPLTQLPVFVGSSMFLSRLSQPPTAFDSEAFLTLTSLAHPDPTAALPIALGVFTLANVESSRWFISAAAREREEVEQKRIVEKRAQGRVVLEPRKIVQSGLRFLSVGRILIGAVVPGVRALSLSFVLLFLSCLWLALPSDADLPRGGVQSVVLYWVSSATFGLLQTWIFDYWERRRSNLRRLATISPLPVPPAGPAATRNRPTQTLASVLKQKRR